MIPCPHCRRPITDPPPGTANHWSVCPYCSGQVYFESVRHGGLLRLRHEAALPSPKMKPICPRPTLVPSEAHTSRLPSCFRQQHQDQTTPHQEPVEFGWDIFGGRENRFPDFPSVPGYAIHYVPEVKTTWLTVFMTDPGCILLVCGSVLMLLLALLIVGLGPFPLDQRSLPTYPDSLTQHSLTQTPPPPDPASGFAQSGPAKGNEGFSSARAIRKSTGVDSPLALTMDSTKVMPKEDKLSTISPSFTIRVDYSQPIPEMVKAGHYDHDHGWQFRSADSTTWTHRPDSLPLPADATVEVQAVLVHLNRAVVYRDALKELDRLEVRAANLPELLALGTQCQGMQLKFPIVALGSTWLNPFSGDLAIAKLAGSNDYRCLFWEWCHRQGEGNCRFLAIRKQNITE